MTYVASGPAPVTVLTGFLGSGKTTLLNYVLESAPNKKVAVIENEFGEEVGIESLVVDAGSGQVFEEVFELGNGCICCSMKGELVRVLEQILQRPERFDHIIVETTGLANPGPVAAQFWVDHDDAEAKYYLDAIVTVCDVKHLLQHLDDELRSADEVNEAERQLAFADRIVLNKTDLLPVEEVDAIEKRVRSINAHSPILRAQKSRVPLDQVIGIKAFSPDRANALLAEPESALSHASSVRTVSFSDPRPMSSVDVFEQWFGRVLWESDDRVNELFRVKAVLHVANEPRRFVLQAVHELFEVNESGTWAPDEERVSRIVFIGRNLNRDLLRQSFIDHVILGKPMD